jgi:hypothetical protein
MKNVLHRVNEGQKEKDSDEKCLSFMVNNINNNSLCENTIFKRKKKVHPPSKLV